MVGHSGTQAPLPPLWFGKPTATYPTIRVKNYRFRVAFERGGAKAIPAGAQVEVGREEKPKWAKNGRT